MPGKINKSHFYAFGSMFIWSIAYIATRVAVQYFSAYDLSFLRTALAAVIFIIILRIKKLGLPTLHDYPIFFISGLLGFALCFITFNLGLQTLTAATSCIIIATSPLFTAVFAAYFFKEKLPPAAWLSLFMALVGTAVLSLWNETFVLDTGIIWTLIAALCIGGYNIIQRQCAKYYPAIQITAYSFITATILMLFLLPDAAPSFIHAPIYQQAIVLGLGILPSALGYLWWTKALVIAESTSTVANYLYLCPFFTLIFGILILDELPNAGVFIGGAIILSSLLLFNIAVKRHAASSVAHAPQVARSA